MPRYLTLFVPPHHAPASCSAAIYQQHCGVPCRHDCHHFPAINVVTPGSFWGAAQQDLPELVPGQHHDQLEAFRNVVALHLYGLRCFVRGHVCKAPVHSPAWCAHRSQAALKRRTLLRSIIPRDAKVGSRDPVVCGIVCLAWHACCAYSAALHRLLFFSCTYGFKLLVSIFNTALFSWVRVLSCHSLGPSTDKIMFVCCMCCDRCCTMQDASVASLTWWCWSNTALLVLLTLRHSGLFLQAKPAATLAEQAGCADVRYLSISVSARHCLSSTALLLEGDPVCAGAR